MTEIIITPALFVTLAFCFWTVVSQWSRRVRLKQVSEFRLQLLNRLMSGDAGVFGREEGDRIVAALIEEAPDDGLAHRLIGTSQAALVLLCLGGGLAFLSARNLFEAADVFFATAVIALCLGAGLALSTLLSWRVGRSLGLLDRRRADPSASV